METKRERIVCSQDQAKIPKGVPQSRNNKRAASAIQDALAPIQIPMSNIISNVGCIIHPIYDVGV